MSNIDWGGLFGGILGAGGGASLVKGAYDKLDDLAGDVRGKAETIGNTAAGMAQFKPFGVTTNTGSAQVDSTGGFNINLAPEQQAMANQLRTGASGMFDSVTGMDTEAREGSVYDRIRAMQTPGEERERLMLEERLQNQGRLGVRTNMFGGTPEQFALSKAQAEARNTAAVQAIQQAQAEQMQQANIGNIMFRNSFAPESQMLTALSQGTQTAGLADIARRQQANLYGQSAMSGLEAQLGAKLGQANLAGQVGTGLLSGALTPAYDPNTGAQLNPFLGGISDFFGGLFGGGS